MAELELISGAIYSRTADGEAARLIGARGIGLVLEDSRGKSFQIPRSEFFESYEPTGIHDHSSYCCASHGIHLDPHRGCVLR